MTQFEDEHFELIKEGLVLFNQQKFWECHEYLEDHWLEMRGDPIRNVFWAVIQIATVNFHVRNENIEGAKGMLSKSLEKILRVEKDLIENKLLEEKLKWSELKRIARSISPQKGLTAFQELYDFKFPNVN